MRFDQTAIAIRERSVAEVFDLAANVMVRHFIPIMIFLLINALPLIVLDYLLVGWMTSVSFSTAMNITYYWCTLLLVISQAQLGTCLITIYLGRVMFLQDRSIKAVLREFFGRCVYFCVSQGFKRLTFFAPLALVWQRDYENETVFLIAYLLLPAIVLTGMIVRISRPYTPEVIYLEKTPLKRTEKSPSLAERSKSLHSLGAASLTSHFVFLMVIAPLLMFAVHSMFVMLDSTLNIRANSEASLQPFYLIISCWLVASFITVARFLMYIDLRIRQEGWAVQLKFINENNLLTGRN